MHFGANSSFLIDFYHLSEYLSSASNYCAPNDEKNWTELQKQNMKDGLVGEVIKQLKKHMDEAESNVNHTCSAAFCYNYIMRRQGQFNHKDAIVNDLSIGSGKIESGHRSVIQKRLKLPGAWWLKNNAQAIASYSIIS